MNRAMQVAMSDTPTPLMGTLAVMGFSAEDNLRNVAQALATRNRSELAKVPERNARQPRLRAEIEEQIVDEMARFTPDTRHYRQLILVSRLASHFERMGADTVDIAQLVGQVLAQDKPSRTADLRKFIEHAVYISDRAASGLVEDDIEMARTAREQKRAAMELGTRINQELAALAEVRADAGPRVDLLCRIATKTSSLVEEAGRLADEIIAFHESLEI